jgi:membrane protein
MDQSMSRAKFFQNTWTGQLMLRYFRSGCSYRAAHLAYLTAICLVPTLTIAVTILSRLQIFDHMAANWQAWLVDSFLVSEAASIRPLITQLVSHALSLSLWHIGVFLIIAILMMVNIGRAFQNIWHTDSRFSWTLRFGIYVLVLLISPVILAVLFIAGGVLNQWFSVIVDQSGYLFLKPVFHFLSYVLLFVWLFLMNWVLPGCRVPVRAAMFAGLITTVLLWAARYVFDLFVMYIASYKILYGPLSVIPIFLVWLYVSWMLILTGALIGHSIVRPFKAQTSG